MLNVNHLSVVYPDGKRAVDHVSFQAGPGETIALIGANGAGKTSLLLALMGVLEAKSGEVSFNGLSLNKKNLPEFRSRLGLVFQDPDDQLFMPNVYEDVVFGPRNLGFSEDKTREFAERALDQLRISDLRLRSPLTLSGGEKRLAAIAAVLSMQPEFLLFDEPTAFLDPRARRDLRGILQNLPQSKLIATHDLAFAADICTRTLVLKDGALAADGGAALLQDAALLESVGL